MVAIPATKAGQPATPINQPQQSVCSVGRPAGQLGSRVERGSCFPPFTACVRATTSASEIGRMRLFLGYENRSRRVVTSALARCRQILRLDDGDDIAVRLCPRKWVWLVGWRVWLRLLWRSRAVAYFQHHVHSALVFEYGKLYSRYLLATM